MCEFNSALFERKLNEIKDLIFYGYNEEDLTVMEKRKMIFDYLISNIKYDYSLLADIVNNEYNKKAIVPRNLSNEIMSVVVDKKGVCNAISQVYKLLLEKVGIYSMCVICDNLQEVSHQLNLVYNKDEKSYSFDDVTSILVGMGSSEDFFNYDLEDANRLGQGTKSLIGDENWFALDTSVLYSLINRTDERYKKLGVVEVSNHGLLNIPTNIRKSKVSASGINNYARR